MPSPTSSPRRPAKAKGEPKKLRCLHCSYQWLPRLKGARQVKCPNCQSRAWDQKPPKSGTA